LAEEKKSKPFRVGEMGRKRPKKNGVASFITGNPGLISHQSKWRPWPSASKTFEEVRERYPEEFEKRGRDMVHYRPPGGESFLDCTARVIPVFFNILHATRGNVLIVAHAGVNRIILCQVLGVSLAKLFDIDQGYGCVNVIRYRDGSFMLQILNGNTV
jgi:broad specificity phosphatase PhoE